MKLISNVPCVICLVEAAIDEYVKITLIPQLHQGNEEVIRVALLTFDLKR